MPAEEFVGAGTVGVNGRHVAGTTVAEHVVQFLADHFLGGVQHFQHGKAVATAKIEDFATFCVSVFYEVIHGLDMRVGDVAHVKVIADAGAVAGVVVGAEDGHLRQLARRHLHDDGDQVVGLVGREFAVQSGRMRPHRVEIAQNQGAHPRVGHRLALDHALADLFRVRVRARGCAQRGLFAHRQILDVAIHGCRRGEQQVLDPELPASLQHVHHGAEVVAVVHQRLLHRLAHGLVGGEMDDAHHAGIFLENTEERLPVADIHPIVLDFHAGDRLHPVHRLRCTAHTAVDGYRLVFPAFYQGNDGVRTEISATARHDDLLFHNKSLGFKV